MDTFGCYELESGAPVRLRPEVRDGVGGWELIDAEWDERTGMMQLDYSRQVSPGVIETATRLVLQPTNPSHIGWESRDRSPEPFALAS